MVKEQPALQSKKKKYRKDKPWDNDPTIDKWKMPELGEDYQATPFLEQSSFATLFPKYREKYIRECFTTLKRSLNQFGIAIDMNLVQGSLTVKTTNKTVDPYAIIKARDCIKLLSRSVPFNHAIRIMQDNIYCDIIKIRSYIRNVDRFVKRRQRLIGPNGATLKALQLLTGCYILVQGSTVSIIGQFKQIKVLRRIIIDVMNNIHPIYHIKQLMVRKELMKDQKMVGQNWDRFIPQFKSIRAKKKKISKEKKEYDPLPPEQQPRKVDIQMQTGQYFLNKKEIQEKNRQKKRAAQQQKALEKQQKNKELQADAIKDQKKRDQKRQSKENVQNAELKALQARFLQGRDKVKLFQ